MSKTRLEILFENALCFMRKTCFDDKGFLKECESYLGMTDKEIEEVKAEFMIEE